MDIVKLKSQIKSGKLDNLYVFVGEEIGLMNLYISKMSDEAHRVDSVAGVWKRDDELRLYKFHRPSKTK